MNKIILFLFPRLGIGGITKSLSFVANSCAEYGFDVICLSFSNEKQTIHLNKKIKIDFLPYENGRNLYYKFLYLNKLRARINFYKPNLIIAFGADYVRMVVLASKGMNIPIIGSERGNPYLYNKKQKNKYSKAFLKCEKVVFQTTGARDYFDKNILSKSIIIPNAAIQRFENNGLIRNKSNNSIVVCSRLSKEKNIEGIIEAFGKSTELLDNYILKIYGDGPLLDYLKQKVDYMHLSDSVVFLGNVNNVFEIEYCASLFVLNSYYEGMPNSLIEAMSIGIPCVATDCPPGGVAFLSDSGRRVKLVNVDDSSSLSKAMEEVCTNKNISEALSKNGQEISAILSPTNISNRWVTLIKEVLDK